MQVIFTFKNVCFRLANSSSKFSEPDSSMPLRMGFYIVNLTDAMSFSQKKSYNHTFKAKLFFVNEILKKLKIDIVSKNDF